jgi:hypothetical protein
LLKGLLRTEVETFGSRVKAKVWSHLKKKKKVQIFFLIFVAQVLKCVLYMINFQSTLNWELCRRGFLKKSHILNFTYSLTYLTVVALFVVVYLQIFRGVSFRMAKFGGVRLTCTKAHLFSSLPTLFVHCLRLLQLGERFISIRIDGL